MNDNKHKVAFYFVLVILLVTLRHSNGHSKDVTEVISHSSRDLPKSTLNITSLGEQRRNYADKNVAVKLFEIRDLLRSLIFDWSLNGESAIIGRTFGGPRIKKLLVPAAFLGGFLTAVILGIKIIGVINMLLISGVLVLNLAVFLGKLFYFKLEKFGHHGHHGHHYHHGPPPYGSYDRADTSSLFRRNFNSPSFLDQPNFNSLPFTGQGFSSAFLNQIPQGFNEPRFSSQIPNFNQPQSAFSQTFNQLQPSITLQQPPTNFQPQPQNINSSPFSGIPMQTAQQVSSATNEAVQPLKQVQVTNQLSIRTDTNPINMMQLLSTTQGPELQNNQFKPTVNALNMISTTTPAVEVQMINLQQIPSSLSPLDILNAALARISEKKNDVQPLARVKRKSSSHHRRQISLLKPLS